MSLAGFGRDLLAEMLRTAKKVVAREGTHLRWATVTDIDPVRIRYDGEANPSIVPPDSVEAGLIVGDRVAVVKQHGQALIVGRAGGSRPPFMLAGGYVDMAGTGTQTVTLPAGVFTSAPIVTISGSEGTPAPTQDVRAYDATTTSFVVLYQRADDWRETHTGTRRFAWHAIQVTSKSASG